MIGFSPQQQKHREGLLRFLGLVALVIASFGGYVNWWFDAATGDSRTLLSCSFLAK